MLIKKTITTKTEETVEVELPQYLRECSDNPAYLKLMEDGAIKITSPHLIWFDEFYSDYKRESSISEYLSKFEPCSEEEFLKHYNNARATIQSHLMAETATV